MANLIKKTAHRLRQPLSFFSAFAAGCLVSSYSPADEDGKEKQAPNSLDQLFTMQEKIEFLPVPAFKGQAQRMNGQSGPLSGAGQKVSPNSVFHPPVAKGSTETEYLGRLTQPVQKSGSVNSTMMATQRSLVQQNQPIVRTLQPQTNSTPQQGYGELLKPRFNTSVVQEASQASFNELSQGSRVSNSLNTPTARIRMSNEVAVANQPSRQVAYVASTSGSYVSPSFIAPKAYSGVYQLRNVDMNQFETSVVQIWGPRLTTSASPDGRYVRVELPTKVRGRMQMMVDRQSGTLTYEGAESLKDNWHNLVEKIDTVARRLSDGTVEQVVVVDGNDVSPATIQQVAYLMGMQDDGAQLPPNALPGLVNQDNEIPAGTQGIKNTIKIIYDAETGAFQLIGDPADVAIIRETILKINKESNAVQAVVERIPLKNLQSESVVEQIQELYNESSYAASKGPVQLQALPSPNSLVVVGQKDAIEAVRQIITSMDVEAPADEAGGFKTFMLKFISAADASVRLNAYFGQLETGTGQNSLPTAPVTVIPDFRTNSVTIKGSVQFVQEAEKFLRGIDIPGGGQGAVNQVKIIPLRNTVAADMAIVIQDAINGQQQNSGRTEVQSQNGAQGGQTQNATADVNSSTLRSPALSLQRIDGGGELTSAIMFDVRVTPDANSNSLVVTGPKESMLLIEELVKQLDRLPNAETMIKVFEIVNGDAQTLFDMLDALFGSDQQNNQGNQGGTSLTQLPLQNASASDGQALVNLRFSVDLRTNTIIASGPAGDLQVVEDLLNRLDSKKPDQAPSQVYRLSNAPAQDVADAINSWLDGVVDLVSGDPRQNNGISTSNRTVIVVPELVSNSLIVSARPEYRAEVERIIKALDRRPPMVKVKILIAEVDLNSLEEFGIELGVQDSLVFDRGTTLGAGGIINGIGFPFNDPTLVANTVATSPGNLAGQALSALGTGRINGDLGYGGLVLSAGNESINILMRALKDKQCVRTLSRPHIMTIENLQGRVSVGAEVPRIAGTTLGGNGNVLQDIEFVDVGVIVEVTPRVSPDGLIVMAVNTKKSKVGPDSTGITIGNGVGGPIIAPQIIETEANTTLMARSGQTVVFSGLIQEEKEHIERGVPILSDLPVVGPLFKFESDAAARSELLIIMTPYLITDDEDINNQNYDEIDRMHWCECDVKEVYGSTGDIGPFGSEGAVETYFPDADPNGARPQRMQQGSDGSGAPQQGSGDYPPQSRLEKEFGQNGVRRASSDSRPPQR
ncbi:MAG: secretin N-terminal domain-containing protein [Mariniblastus sp.]|nr:secretin N-terminal domain-containing protein [Mariniblastus sp.]